jgi:hypothetical protein
LPPNEEEEEEGEINAEATEEWVAEPWPQVSCEAQAGRQVVQLRVG